MGIEYYMFAIFVFVLALIVAFLVIKGLQKNKTKQNAEMEEKEKKIMMMYTEVEEFLEGVEEYITKSKEELEELKYSANRDFMEIKKLSENFAQKSKEQPVKKEKTLPIIDVLNEKNLTAQASETEEKTMEIVNGDTSNKRKMRLIAMDMQRKGASVEKIAEELKVSKGEINLMLSLKFQNLQVSDELE